MSLVWGLMAAPSHASTRSAAGADVALQVSFDPAAAVRLRGDHFSASTGVDLSAVNAALSGRSLRVERLFKASEADIDAQRRRLLDAGKRAVPDLNRHFRIVARDASARDELVAALERSAVVERAEPESEPTPAPATADLTGEQRYRTAAPLGVDATALAARPGGRGERVKIVDVEYSWNRSHEDLAAASGANVPIVNGSQVVDPFNNTNHGTAVLGELIGTDNGLGVTGLVPNSEIGLVNAYTDAGWRLANAVHAAHQHLSAGDVLLVEQQVDGPEARADDYVAAEYEPAVYDAIKLATQDGIIVVEPAGNGGVNLDAPGSAAFPSGKPDSGAIIVGAGSADCSDVANARVPMSTYGNRVDLQGWGTCVTTTGFGTHPKSGTTLNSLYTANFNGTSSAAAMVAGAAALFSSVYEASTNRSPTPQFVRSRMIATGTQQGLPAGGHIGPLPDLAAALNLDFTPPSVSFTDGPSATTSDSTPTFAFSSEAGVAYRCRVVGLTAPAPCTSPYTTPALADGAWILEVVATDPSGNSATATRAFTIDTTPVPAPSAPTGGSSAVVPTPPPASEPAGTAPAGPAASVAPLSFGPGAKMTVRATSAGWVSLPRPKLSCPALAGSCKLTAKVRPAAGGRQIGVSIKTVAAGASATISFRLTKSARTALRRRGSLKASVRIEARQGSVLKTRTVTLTIRRSAS
ncbi:MAG: serine protease [Solirubrobacteraceae bacterium]|jgi:hypothetical protein|nr:serine protease [Solirubrobacteraceae bacterium]